MHTDIYYLWVVQLEFEPSLFDKKPSQWWQLAMINLYKFGPFAETLFHINAISRAKRRVEEFPQQA